MTELLQPVHFDKIILGVQKVCAFNESTAEFKIPSMANHLGIYLKECANVLYSACIVEQNDKKKKLVHDFKELIALQYGISVSRSARKTLEERKWNKPKLLPVISDIHKFRDNLLKTAETTYDILNKDGFSYIEWRKLIEVTATLVLIFNRKRPGERERILLKNYFNKQTIEKDSEDYKTLTTLEKLLCCSFKRVELRGKLGRRVPILLRHNHIKYIETFVRYRKTAGVSESNIYLFGLGKNNFVRITDIIRRESTESGASKPQLLRATYLRKQVATTSQILDLNDNEMQMLADFMGHDIEIHRAHYRTPELLLQVVRLSKILLAVDEGDLASYKDKNLRNINIQKYLLVSNDTEVDCDEPSLETHNSCFPHDHFINTATSENTVSAVSQCSENPVPNITKINENIDRSPKGEENNTPEDTVEPPDSPSSASSVEHATILCSSKAYFRTPPKRSKIKRITWKTPEKKSVRTIFKHF